MHPAVHAVNRLNEASFTFRSDARFYGTRVNVTWFTPKEKVTATPSRAEFSRNSEIFYSVYCEAVDPNLRYAVVALRRQTLCHYGVGIRLLNSESRDLIGPCTTISCTYIQNSSARPASDQNLQTALV